MVSQQDRDEHEGRTVAERARELQARLEGAGIESSLIALGEGPRRSWALRVQADGLDEHALDGLLTLARSYDARVWMSRGVLRLHPREPAGVIA